jgi:UDP-N-acetylmuramate--alanine ligase
MDLNKVNKIYFLGIGGIGMSALARYFNFLGAEIYGYDLTPSPLTRQLEDEGMHIHYDINISAIPSKLDFVVFTPAIPKENKELIYFRNSGFEILKRAELIGKITKDKFTIAIAGTHGKTSISALTAHLINSAQKNVTAFVGGIMKNYNSNLIYSDNAEIFLVEADEYDRSFLQLTPDIAVISSIDADHLDIYEDKFQMSEGFRSFASRLKENGKLILNEKIQDFKQNTLTYGFDAPSEIKAKNIHISDGKFVFDIEYDSGAIKGIRMMIPGHHYIENALAAVTIGIQLNINDVQIKSALESFKGVERRFEIRVNTNKTVYIDDYAHHPQEIMATLRAIRLLFPNRKLTGIFQPHLYSRTRDFADEFAQSLENLDEIILLPIYPARENPIEGVSSEMLLGKMKNINKHLVSKVDLLDFLKNKHIDVLVSMGAGDIGLMATEIEKLLTIE